MLLADRIFLVRRRRRILIGAVIALVVVAAGATAAAEGAFGHSAPAAHEAAGRSPATASGSGGSTPSRASGSSTSRTAGPLKDVYDPPRPSGVTDDSIQRKITVGLGRVLGRNVAKLSAIEALTLPPPVPSAAFPAISHQVRRDPGSYARAFVRELLDLDFAKQSRAALLEWVVSETSPANLPGIPALAEPKILYSEIVKPTSPVPNAAGWAADAKAGVTWSVSDLSTLTPPAWTKLISTGWEPPDLRTDFLEVSGNLTMRHPGQAPLTQPFSVYLVVGTAEYHHGYGAMIFDNWTAAR